jgi:acyl carrier protein
MGSAEAGTMRELVVGHSALPDEDLGPDGHSLPAGHAVADKEVLLLDDDGRPVPPGEIGEIVVRSDFLARGYWRRPDLDAAVFSPVAPGSPGRVCRTGDLGRLLPGALLMHLGRKDTRAKLRGRFVDASEIEAALVAWAAVVREDRPGDQRLVAYVVPQKTAEGPALTPGDVLRAARARLDASLAPSAVVFLDALPLAPNGKIDRRAFPAPPRMRVRSDGPPAGPRTRIEAEVLRVWADVLALDDIGVQEHFVELGGTSLVAGRIATLVSERFGVDLPARELLDAPTVADMAVVVTARLLGRLDPEAVERGLAGGEASAGG